MLKEIITSARKHPLAAHVARLGASQYACIGLGLLTALIAARTLGASEYGRAALAIAFPSLLWSLLTVKSVSVTTRYVAIFRVEAKTSELRGVCKLGSLGDATIAFVTFVIVAATAHLVATRVYHQRELALMMIAFAASLPLASLAGTSMAVLTTWQSTRTLAVAQIAEKLVALGTFVSLAALGFGASALVLATAIAQAGFGVSLACAALTVLRKNGIANPWTAPLAPLSLLKPELRKFFASTYLVTTFAGITAHLPLIMLGRYAGASAAGFYRLAMSVQTGGSITEMALARVTYPVLAARWARRQNLRATLIRWTLRAGLPAGLLVLAAVPLLPVLMKLAFGAGFKATVPGAQVLLVGTAFSAVFFWLNAFYYIFGRIGLYTKLLAANVAVFVVLTFLAARYGGFFHICMVAAFCQALANIVPGVIALRLSDGSPASTDNRNRHRLRVCFIGCARYANPLNATLEKKFRALAAVNDLYVIGFSPTVRPQRFCQYARFYCLPLFPAAALRTLNMMTAGTALALWCIVRHGAEVLIAQSPYEGCAAAIAKILARAFGRDVRLVVESHGDFERAPFLQREVPLESASRAAMRTLPRFSIARADALRSVSRAGTEQLRLWAPTTPIISFPAWTDLDAFLRVPDSIERKLRIIYAGVLAPLKGVHHLVNAFALVRQVLPAATLLIVGREQNREYVRGLREQVVRLGLGEAVHFQNEVSQPELARSIQASSVLCLPSLSEGLGRVLLEAMACGLPVVASDVGGIPELVRDGENGFLVDVGDETALSERLERLLMDPELRQRMGECGRQFAREFFSAEKYVGWYSELIALAQRSARREEHALASARI